MSSYILFTIFILPLVFGKLSAQTVNETWLNGTGSATGSNIVNLHSKALNKARTKALQKAGIEINSGEFSLKSEGNKSLVDFFTEFTETSARGLILDEKNIHFDPPVPLDSTYTVYRVTAHVKVLVGIPKGTKDPEFEVYVITNRETYKEYEPVTLHVRTTEAGYLTIIDLHEDSIIVLFPNSLDGDNYIKAGEDFLFPPSKTYSLEFKTENGQENSSDLIIAIVTKDKIPFPNINTINLKDSNLMLAEKNLTTYANWLYKIPLDRRCADIKQIYIEK